MKIIIPAAEERVVQLMQSGQLQLRVLEVLLDNQLDPCYYSLKAQVFPKDVLLHPFYVELKDTHGLISLCLGPFLSDVCLRPYDG